MKNAERTETTEDSKAPKLSVEYPTAEEMREFSKRCEALCDAVKSSKGFMGTAAFRAAMDLDYLARLVDADPVKHIGQWTMVIKSILPPKSRPTKKSKKKK